MADALPMLRFHYHIYYRTEARAAAWSLHESLVNAGFRIEYPRFHEKLVGPHPLPMFSGEFARDSFTEIVTWLMRQHGPHSVLIHPETESERVDHSLHALWLGAPVSIDYTKLAN